MQKVFVSWSGGKDSCFACYKAKVSGLKVCYLLNMVTEDGKISWTHGLSTELLKTQSKAIEVPIIQRRTTMNNYETEFKETLRGLKQKGVGGGVFGDIDLNEHRQWVESVCREADMTPHLPLWGQKQEKVLSDFVASGFEAIIVAAKADLFDEEWIGRKVDEGFIRDLDVLRKTKEITPCGEAGEYHTFVINGPIFRQKIEIQKMGKIVKEGYRFLEISGYKLKPK
ncbi:MAG: diphthine--ammonia ligase [Chloroflexi bacterium]|nr:diphthine--ammonia ligase [Chloroflexota bacterium]